jgi:hypothetical protein
LNFAIETFLTELVFQFQIQAFEQSGLDFWRLWTSTVADERDRIVEILSKNPSERDADDLERALGAYLGSQRQLFENNPKLAGIVLSDAASIAAISTSRFSIPDYRNSQIHAEG